MTQGASTEFSLDEVDLPTRSLALGENNGSLDVEDVQPLYQWVVERFPVVRWDGGVALFRYEDVVAATRNRSIVSYDPLERQPIGLGSREPLIPLNVDGAEHARYRRLLDPPLSARKVAWLEASTAAYANELIDGFVDDGRVEFHDGFAVPFPTVTFLRLFGLPEEDLPTLLRLKDGIIRNGGRDNAERYRLSIAAGDELRRYIRTQLERRRPAPRREDLLSRLMSLEDDGTLAAEELVSIVHLFVVAGLDTVTSSLTCIIGWLARHPLQRQRLVDDPAIVPSAIEELLRHQSPVAIGGRRYALKDTDVNGIRIAAGDKVTLGWATANHDAAKFHRPDIVDFDRAVNPHLAFASGIHRCLGSHLARLELRVAVCEWNRRIPRYTVTPNETPRWVREGVREALRLPLSWSGT